LARPEDGLLQWKKRRGTAVDVLGNFGHFYVRLPKKGAARFLWNSPLFTVERSTLTLHLGLPEGPSDEDVVIRYSRWVSAVYQRYLYCERPPGEYILERLHGLFGRQALPPPNIEVIQSSAGWIS
jgi:hypothetical protein